MEYKYKVSILSMFKNEEMIMEEWINHYISEGIQHFYLIDNGSTDNYKLILNNYLDKITLVEDSTRDKSETQPLLYNKHYLEVIKKESEWLIVCDMDEYIYSRKSFKTILDYINNIPEHIECITLPWKNFGNNGVRMQPKSIVSTFTMHEEPNSFKQRTMNANYLGHCKSLTKTKNINRLNVHINQNIKKEVYFSDFTLLNFKSYDIKNQNLHINHYQHMSFEYYTKIKMLRGRGQCNMKTYDLNRFNHENTIFNRVRDLELSNKKNV